MIRIGITEAGDAGLHLEWAEKMGDVHSAILITKSVNERFLAALVPVAPRVLIHVTCTGYGGTVLEPGAPTVAWTRAQYTALIEVVPPEQTVLRVDPVIPTSRGLATAETVLQAFRDTPVQRVRFSYLDMHPHVAARFAAAQLPHPYQGRFTLSPRQRDAATAVLERWTNRYQFEACAEPGFCQAACLSKADAGPLGFDPQALEGRKGQRRACL